MAEKHRSISERWVVSGTLVLESPAHFGNGDADPLTDMPLLFDEASGKPLLTGTSIAGALRNYLREYALGYGKAENAVSLASRLFGGFRGDPEGEQSPLIVYDAMSEKSGFELRDGVKIDPETRTAKDKAKFDVQLLAAGTEFPLCFELLIGKDNEKALLDVLATALDALENGKITLGMRKRRGFGRVSVKNWQVWKYTLKTKAGLLAWLSRERDWKTDWPEEKPRAKSIVEKLGATLLAGDARQTAHLEAKFTIEGTLMIRSGVGESNEGPDMVHLHAPRVGKTERKPVIPGTSWAGVLRGRALKIARTVSEDLQAVDQDGRPRWKDQEKKDPLREAEMFVDGLFGSSEINRENSKKAKASRISIRESEIKNETSLVVTRIKIDRFTGGAFEGALFSEQPVIGKPGTENVVLNLILRNPQDAELGLLLLLLKDLWTGDLPIGGESSIGRGRLKGICATLTLPDGKWEFTTENEKIKVVPESKDINKFSEKYGLEKLVRAFNDEMQKAQVNP